MANKTKATSKGSTKSAKAGKKKSKTADAQGGDAVVQVETEIEVSPAADAPPSPPAPGSLAELSARYLAHLEKTASLGTRMSYGLEMATALDELGADTLLADLSADRVLEFMVGPRVMRTKTGVAKAPPTIAKTRRVLRQALEWGAANGVVEKAPLPEMADLPY